MPNKMLTEKEVLEIKSRNKTQGMAEDGECYVNKDIDSLCLTVLELQRLLQAKKEARKVDAKKIFNLLDAEDIYNESSLLPIKKHFKKIARG